MAGFVDTDFKIEGCAESIFYRRRGVYLDGIVFIKVFFVEKAVSKYIFFIQAQIFYHFSQGGMCRNHVDFVIDFASAPYEITEWKAFEHGRLHTSSPAVFIADEYVCFY